MDYFKDAFGGFEPQSDKDAALKFSLCVLLLDNRTEELRKLVAGSEGFGGVEGDPGWIIERREDGETTGYEAWPEDARFRAYVDPDSYSLSYPEFFCEREKFFEYVQAIVAVYERRYPEHECVIRNIKDAMTSAMK